MNKREQAEFDKLKYLLKEESKTKVLVALYFVIIVILLLAVIFMWNKDAQQSVDKINGVTYIDNNAYLKFDLQDPVQASMLNSIIAYCTQNDLRYCMINPEAAK